MEIKEIDRESPAPHAPGVIDEKNDGKKHYRVTFVKPADLPDPEAGRPPPPKPKPKHAFECFKSIWFDPNPIPIGLDKNPDTNAVTSVAADSQGSQKGVQVGWIAARIGHEKFTQELFEEKMKGQKKFPIVFRTHVLHCFDPNPSPTGLGLDYSNNTVSSVDPESLVGRR